MMLLRSLCGFAVVLVALAGCGDVRDSLGLGRDAPDEFAVVDRPPLSLPPDFNLHPPKPGAPRPQEINTTQRASDVVFGGDKPDNAVAVDASVSDVEKSVLVAAGATHADPNIRQTVDREASQKIVSSESFVDQLLWWRDQSTPAATVDASAEAQRLKEVKAKGEPVNHGGTPVIERQKHGWLGI